MQMESNVNLTQVIEHMSEACFFLNSNWEFVFINKVAEPYVRAAKPNVEKSKDKFIGESIWNTLPKYIDSYFYNIAHIAYDEQKPKVIEMFGKYTKQWLEVRLFP